MRSVRAARASRLGGGVTGASTMLIDCSTVDERGGVGGSGGLPTLPGRRGPRGEEGEEPPRYPEEGGTRGKHGFPREREPKASVRHSTAPSRIRGLRAA